MLFRRSNLNPTEPAIDPALTAEVEEWSSRKPTTPRKRRLEYNWTVVFIPFAWALAPIGFFVGFFSLIAGVGLQDEGLMTFGIIGTSAFWIIFPLAYIILGVIFDGIVEAILDGITRHRGWIKYDDDRKAWEDEGDELQSRVGWNSLAFSIEKMLNS